MPILDIAPPPQPQPGRLGRHVHFDARSVAFPIRALLTGIVAPRSYTWKCVPDLDQDSIGACVGFSVCHELAARPVVLPVSEQLAFDIYYAAQKHDPWPGEAYEGTSVLAGMDEAKTRGLIFEYRWAFGLEDLVLAVGYKGPAVLGINWYESMFDVAADGFISISGNVAGGHAILMNGVACRWSRDLPINQRTFANLDLDRSFAKLHNSWGPNWGVEGSAFIRLRDLDRLLHEMGEACIPTIRR